MTNKIAVFLGTMILMGLCIDYFAYDGDATLFVGGKLADMIEWLAFWR